MQFMTEFKRNDARPGCWLHYFHHQGAEVGPGGDGGVVADAGGGGEGGGDLDGAAGVLKGPGFADVLAVAQAVAAGSEQGGEIDRDKWGGIPVEDGEGAQPAFGFGERDDAGQRGGQGNIGEAGGIQRVRPIPGSAIINRVVLRR